MSDNTICKACDGKGRILLPQSANHTESIYILCNVCKGKGTEESCDEDGPILLLD